MITSPSTSMKLTACLHLLSAGLRLTLAILNLSLLPCSDVGIFIPWVFDTYISIYPSMGLISPLSI